MTEFKNKPGFGALFLNDKKSENAPDYRGTFADLAGVEHEIAGWKRQGKRGEFVSLKISLPRDSKPVMDHRDTVASDLNDDIPF